MGKAENLAGQRRIGFVLYPISANISYGKGDASETNIAAKLSNAHGFIRGHQQVFLMAPDRMCRSNFQIHTKLKDVLPVAGILYSWWV